VATPPKGRRAARAFSARPLRRKESAGLLLFRRSPHGIEVLLAHPGGPFWQSRDAGAWTVPKGGIDPGETALDAAIREFGEETGFEAAGPFIALGSVTQRSGKIVHVWAFEGDCDPARLTSVETTTEWPPHSGRFITIPEIDRAAFFSIAAAHDALNVAQVELLDRLAAALRSPR
jgi:predicted NUDIX family NTP pyrophosphohydrolase